jgi:hypothetical protein
MKRAILIALAVSLIIPSLIWAAGAGDPAALIGKGNYAIAVEGEEQIKRIDGDLLKSRRYVGKVVWGATERLDVYARLGVSDLRVEDPDYPDFETSPRSMTWGGGARYFVAGLEKPKLAAYVDLQMLAFFAKSSVDIRRTAEYNGDVDTYLETYWARYKYNEIQFSFITKWDHEVFEPYAGFGLTNVFGHVDREVRSEIQTGAEKSGNDFREYGIPELIMGLDVGLGGTGRLSAEIRLSNDSDVSYFIGLSELY